MNRACAFDVFRRSVVEALGGDELSSHERDPSVDASDTECFREEALVPAVEAMEA